MLSKNRIRYIRSLEQKKVRKAEQVFLAEGPKTVGELLGRFPCRFLLATREWLALHPCLPVADVAEVTPEELSRASLQKTPQQVLAVFAQPADTPDLSLPERTLCLALDEIQDPGNLGTIVRLADWFGITHIYCSPGTVDAFSPKVVQASMGALARVGLHYTPLPALIRSLRCPVYGTTLHGDDLYTQPLSPHGLLVMGNEGNGITPEVEALVTRRLYIPHYPATRPTSESLNVAIATAVVCAEFRRRL